MQIRFGAALTALLVSSVLCIGLPVISFRSFALIERQELVNDLKQSLNILHSELQQLNTTAGDYSGWDETYRFVQDENEQYLTNSLGESFYTKLRLNVFLLFNKDGRMLFGRGHDYYRNIRKPVPESLLRQLSPASPLLQHPSTDHTVAGLISLPEGILLIVSRPVLTSEYQGPIRGTLVMGRFLDGAELKRIGSLVQHNLSFLTVSGSARAEYERIDRLLTGRDAVRVKVLDSDFIAGYTRVPGVFGGNAGILMVTKSRELIREARFATWLFSIVCGTSVALLISYYLLARKRLHAFHQIEKLSHERMQAIIDLAVDGIFIIDAGGKILSHNVRSCEITGLTSEEMGLMTLDRLFTDGNADLPSITHMLPAGTETVTSERELKKRDGTSVVVEMRVKRMPDASLQCFMRDITERKAMEQGLVEQRDIISSMAAELSLAEERERCRIAGELHDQVAPTLLLGKMKLASLGSSLDAPDQEQALAAIGELIDRSVEEIRSLTFQMRPPILANAGLEAALRWLGEEFRENYGLEVVILNDPTTKPLNYETRSTLFQIVRELLLNITKHAGTPQATVSLSRTETMITVRVEDRGKGFDVNGSTLLKPKSGGFGIFNAQKKIEFLGGSLTIDSVPGEGTVAEISAPLDLSRSDGE